MFAQVGSFINSHLFSFNVATVWACAIAFDYAVPKLLINVKYPLAANQVSQRPPSCGEIVEPEVVNGNGYCVKLVSGRCKRFLMSIYISLLALLISVLGCVFPRTVGCPVK